ncbi:hypothetical protein PLESTB_001767800 [Pleodorina starrii]|uniref:Uncharacterized protein n=1 Tax=Pleodorina starrii TaxID=330485 RepID=A0A9W6F9M3_9CHLO|nr:hypothetical protein PLESTM_001863000 [Pleodorina starrii]GLC61542.1 hypothetical protein PLESTB_001767800 [Pleodorina starrii]GLC76820.1 hypothetical protein PLESTF_001844600 [Pleodorina starrii]
MPCRGGVWGVSVPRALQTSLRGYPAAFSTTFASKLLELGFGAAVGRETGRRGVCQEWMGMGGGGWAECFGAFAGGRAGGREGGREGETWGSSLHLAAQKQRTNGPLWALCGIEPWLGSSGVCWLLLICFGVLARRTKAS